MRHGQEVFRLSWRRQRSFWRCSHSTVLVLVGPDLFIKKLKWEAGSSFFYFLGHNDAQVETSTSASMLHLE